MRLLRWHPSSQSHLATLVQVRSFHLLQHRVLQHRAIPLLLLTLCLAFFSTFDTHPVQAESNVLTATHVAFGREYAVPNGPRNLAEEAPGRIWFTSTDAGGIGFLEVISKTSTISDTSTITDTTPSVIRYRTDFYGFGENSEPYDLVYVDGVVWFTLRGVRALGRIDVETREIDLYTLLSVGAAPTGIDNDPDGNLWIAQSNGRISRFDPITESFEEFVLPANLRDAPRMEDVAYENDEIIWFSMPDANRLVTFDPLRNRFSPYGLEGLAFAPHTITIAEDGGVWVSATGSNNVGRLTPSTISDWGWYPTPSAESGPTGLLVYIEGSVTHVWIAENALGTIGRLQLIPGFKITNREKLGPNSPPGSTWGIIRTADEHIWVADAGRNLLYELVDPYIQRTYMVSIENEQAPPPE